MANQTVVSAAAIWQGLFDTLTKGGTDLDFTKKGQEYFVEVNTGSNLDDGSDWEKAFATLAYAITISNANIATTAGAASRNRIYVRGNKVEEDLTVPPINCDVIGCGSNDAEDKTHIIGEHAWTGSATLEGSGFYNLTFSNDDASPIFAVATVAGLYFGNCDFIASNDSIHAIHLTGSTGHDLRLINCRIINDSANDPFDTAGILMATTTTFYNLEIRDSYIEGDIGIKIDTTHVYNGVIDNCTVKAVVMTIDDNSDDVVIKNCRMITATTAAAGLDVNKLLCIGSVITGSDRALNVPNPANFLGQSAYPTQGLTYYVHKGGDDTTGLTWEHAFTTIAAAIAASNATIDWANNEEDNVILIAPGTYTESLTTVPYYCHMIGLGVGTLANSAMSVRIEPASGVCMSSDTCIGLHLKNIAFVAKGAVDILDFVICNDVLIEDCMFAPGDNNVVNAISTENSDGLNIRNCKFKSGLGTGGFTRCMYFGGGADKYLHNALIENNILQGMDATGTGIFIQSTCTATQTIIKGNIIHLFGAGIGIDDNSDNAIVEGNKVFHVGGTPYDINAALSMNNRANDNGTVTEVPDLAQY